MAKNKAKKVSAKAARNLEALKKTKEAAMVEEKKAAEQIVQPQEEKPVEEPKKPVETKQEAEKKSSFPVGKTAHETFKLIKKHPHAGMISMVMEKDSHGVEQIRVKFKNHETNEESITVFPVSHVVPEDNINLDELRKAAGLSKSEEQKEEKKKEPTIKSKSSEKTSNKSKKESVIEEPAVTIVEPSNNNRPNTPKVIKDFGDRIDANHGIELMNAVNRRREEIRDSCPIAYEAAGKQADLMMWYYLQKWNSQLTGEAAEAGIKVSEEMMNYLNENASLMLGIKALPSKVVDGQLSIDFNETMQQVPEETRKAIEQDAVVVAKPKEEIKIPTPEECTTDEEKLNAIRLIAGVKNAGKGTMGKNLENVINFAKNAFNFENNTEPAQVVAFVIDKFNAANQSVSLFQCFTNATFGNLTGNLSSLASHGWLKSQLPMFDDKQISQLTRVFLAKAITELAKKENKDEKELLASYGALLGGMNDDLINRIIKSAKENGKGEEKLIYPTIKNLDLKGKHIFAIKTVNNLKVAYGDLSDKLLKQQMQKIINLYIKKDLNPLVMYTEKSTYATNKK